MAISDGTAGAWVATVTRNPTVTLPAHTAGQMLLVRVGWKSDTPTTDVATCATAGWAKLGQFYNSGGASSNGGGGVLVAVFWKVAASDAETNPVIEYDDASAPNPGCYSAVSYSKGAGDNWDAPVGDAGAIAAATSYSGTIQSHVAATSGDMLDAFVVTNDNTTLTVPTVAQTGLTLDTVTEYPATALSSTTGFDCAADGCNRLATAGTSSAAAVASGTNSVADPGAAWVTRLRVAAANNILVTPGVVNLTTALFAPTVSVSDNKIVTPGPAGGAGYAATVLADSPIAYWRLGEPSGTTANDEIGTADGVYTNSPTLGATGLLTGDSDTAVTFARASTQYAHIATGMPAGGASGASIEALISFTTTLVAGEMHYIFSWGNESTPGYHGLKYRRYDATTWQFYWMFSDGTSRSTFLTKSGTDPLPAGTHVVGAAHDYAAKTCIIYVDGSSIGTIDLSAYGAPLAPAAGLVSRIGAFMGNLLSCADATIDEPAVYDYALSAARFAAHNTAATNAPSGLVLTAFAPTVTVGANVTVTPPAATLALTPYAPTVTASDPQTVTPGAAALTLTPLAPVVTASDNQTITPGAASLALTAFAPSASVSDHKTVTPGVASLALTPQAPTVSATAHQTVTPSVASLTLTPFAPTVTGGAGLTVTPGSASLALTAFAPSTVLTDHKLVTPGVASLALTPFAPLVTAGAGLTVVPGVASLTMTAFAPNVVLTDNVTVSPGPAALAMTAFAPDVVLTDHKLVTPGTASLSLTAYAPTVTAAAVLGLAAQMRISAPQFRPLIIAAHDDVPVVVGGRRTP